MTHYPGTQAKCEHSGYYILPSSSFTRYHFSTNLKGKSGSAGLRFEPELPDLLDHRYGNMLFDVNIARTFLFYFYYLFVCVLVLFLYRSDVQVTLTIIFEILVQLSIYFILFHLWDLSSLLIDNLFCGAGKYREFHVMYQEGRYEEAAALLVSLISSRLAPE